LIGLTSCLKARLFPGAKIADGQLAQAKTALDEYRQISHREIFISNWQDHGVEMQRTVNRTLIELARGSKYHWQLRTTYITWSAHTMQRTTC